MFTNSAEVFSFGILPSLILIAGIVTVLFFILRLIQIGMNQTGDHRSLHRKFARGDVKEMRRRTWQSAARMAAARDASIENRSPPPPAIPSL